MITSEALDQYLKTITESQLEDRLKACDEFEAVLRHSGVAMAHLETALLLSMFAAIILKGDKSQEKMDSAAILAFLPIAYTFFEAGRAAAEVSKLEHIQGIQ